MIEPEETHVFVPPARASSRSATALPRPTSVLDPVPVGSNPAAVQRHSRVPSGVISSLINSLAAISTPLEEHYDNIAGDEEFFDPQDTMLSAHTREPSTETGSTSHDGMAWLIGTDEDYSDPNAGRSPGATHLGATSTLVPPLRESMQSNRSRDTSLSIGIPSIERPHSSSTMSFASSTKIGAIDEISRQLPSRDALVEQRNDLFTAAHKNGSSVPVGTTKSLRPSRSEQSLREREDGGSRPTTPLLTPFGLAQIQTSHSPRMPPSSPDSAISTETPILSGHLIPSRRSSLRHHNSERPYSRDSKHPSSSGHDPKTLNIDQDLIEEDDSTVRRILELRDAKDKRQREWRKDAKKSEKTKRNSTPNSQTPAKPRPRPSSQSVVGILMEVPSKEAGESEHISVTQVGKPGEQEALDLDRNTNAATVAPPEHSSLIGVKAPVKADEARADKATPPLPRHRRGLSTALKRSVTSNSVANYSDSVQSKVDDEVEAYLSDPRFNQKVRHPLTGRVIAFSEVGDPEGFPVICCVGMGLTRYLTAFYDELARSLNLRLITPDRPGIGGSQPRTDGQGTPLSWADDVYILTRHLEITRFSLLAHSAGAIYALAVALRLPQYLRGRIRLLSPWIPPSQLLSMSSSKDGAILSEVPFSQRLLAVLPASFLKMANSSFMSATSASASPKGRSKRRSGILDLEEALAQSSPPSPPPHPSDTEQADSAKPENVSCYQAQNTTLVESGAMPLPPPPMPPAPAPVFSSYRPDPNYDTVSAATRIALYDATLTHRIWDLATKNANPAVDLLVCLERRAPIGFHYTDVTRAVIIHHGSHDNRVSVDKALWLGKVMRRCEVRVIEGGDHSLMANASVMAEVLDEVGMEWEELNKARDGLEGKERRDMHG